MKIEWLPPRTDNENRELSVGDRTEHEKIYKEIKQLVIEMMRGEK